MGWRDRRRWSTLVAVAGALAVAAAGGPASGEAGGEASSSDAPPHKVVGGQPVAPGTWPDCAAVVFGESVGCTGVLISPQVVLTAAHCVGGITEVHLSTWDLDQAPGEVLAVAQEIAYPGWMSSYDIGLLILDGPSATPPRLIAHGCATSFVADGAAATVVGWGATDTWGTVYPTDLMAGDIQIEDADCSDMAAGCNPAVSPNGELVAGGGGVDGCYGDSGGPLYLRTPLGDWLVGITSRGVADATVPCGDGGIYARPDAIIAWIEQQAGITLPEPSCDPAIFADGFESGDTTGWSAASRWWRTAAAAAR